MVNIDIIPYVLKKPDRYISKLKRLFQNPIWV